MMPTTKRTGGSSGSASESAEVRGRFGKARASGATLRQAAQAAGVSRTAGHNWLKESGGVRPRPKAPRPALRLSLAEREEISRGLAREETLTTIADRMAHARTRRPRPGKLATNERLRERVEEGLKDKWSPQQISARLRLDFPDDPTMRVSHETIYTSLFVQAKGGLPGQLTVHLRK